MSNVTLTQTTVTLQYDAIGNILQDGYWQYTWQSGRQLKAMQHGEAEDADYERLDFAYNADGLRVRKSYTRNAGEGMPDTTVTDYILHGKNIMHMRVTENGALTDEMHFFYDAQGRPALTEHTSYAAGIVATNSYAYIHDLQGDTVGLVDAFGTECVRYTYDAWGRMISISGTKATTLGLLQPFRYRGYVYDEETGLYYLRSRYYRPDWHRFINTDILINGNLYSYCGNSPIIFEDKSGYLKEYTEEYIRAIQIIIDYSIENKDNPKCISSDEFLNRCEKNVGKYSYDRYQCAASIAILLPHGASHTGMSSMFDYDILEGTELFIESIGGNEYLIEGMIVAIYEPEDKDNKPYNHGGIVRNEEKVYHSTRKHKKTCKNGFYLDEYCNRSWNVCGWHKGVIAGETLLNALQTIVNSVKTVIREDE